MHRIDLSEMPPKRSARTHLDATDRLQIGRGLGQRRVTRRFARIAYGILECLRLLTQAVQFIHLHQLV